MKKYYHGSFPTDAKINEMMPEGFYEKINERTGCPEASYASGFYIGFPTSNILERSFSKSKSGAILGKGRWCADDWFLIKMGKKVCTIDLYETTKKPDVDISDCSFDFGELEEVRYRKKTPVKKIETVHLSERFVKQLGKAYHSDWDEESRGEPPSEPDTVLLGCLKKHVESHLNNPLRQGDLRGLTDLEMNKCYAKDQGISIEQYKKESMFYEEDLKKKEELGGFV